MYDQMTSNSRISDMRPRCCTTHYIYNVVPPHARAASSSDGIVSV